MAVALVHFLKISKRNGLLFSSFVLSVTAIPWMSSMATLRLKTFWLPRGIGCTFQTSRLPLSQLSFPRTTLRISRFILIPQGDGPAT